MTISDEPKIVRITWMDAVSIDATPALVEIEDMETLHPIISYIVGYLIQDNKDCYVLSKEFWPEPMKIKYLHVIPKGAVIKIEELKTAKGLKEQLKEIYKKETVTEEEKVTPKEKELPKELPKKEPTKENPGYSKEEVKDKIIKVLKKSNGINCISIARKIFGPNVVSNKGPGLLVAKMCSELTDGILTQKKGAGQEIINTLIDSKISHSETDDSEITPDIPHPTGETFMDRDEIADKIMDSMLDTTYRTRRELCTIVFGTTEPKSKELAKLKRTLDMLQKFRIVEMDSRGDVPAWFLTYEGEEIAKNKRAKREATK